MEAKHAPILPPEDLAWETFEKVEALFEQGLLQRANNRLYVAAGAEGLDPENDTDADGVDDVAQAGTKAPKGASLQSASAVDLI